MLLILPEDVLALILTFTDPATLSRWETALPSRTGSKHLRSDGVFDHRWRELLDWYNFNRPTRFSRKYRTAKEAFVRHAGRLCIGTRREPGCWAYTPRDYSFVAQAFGEPKLCKRCEFFRFVSKSRAVDELRNERRRLLPAQRKRHQMFHAALLESAVWNHVFRGRISCGVFARRCELNMDESHVMRYIPLRFY
jgi:hypothetical protein